MQFSAAAILALAATVAATSNGTVVYTTEVHTAYTTVCPASTQVTFNGVTYTATASETLTITNCPCTVVKPVTTSSVVYCATCAPSSVPVYANTTAPAASTAPATTPVSVGTTSAKVSSATATPSTITASSGNKAFALSGASLAGLLGLAAYVL